ncbi:MAG: extracellular solute-binding protein [Oscillospiraceae bacterium]|jgi:arabinogalactan oligomer/maltooligosaccharide transport system substrate-binding protein|nr:extracellular solute-binding protein [Oscillospiraceae bacterium]
MKKLIALTLAALMLLAFMAGCATSSDSPPPGGGNASPGSASPGGAPGEVIDLLVWGPQEGQAFLQKAIEEFQAANPGTTYNFTLGVVGEDMAQTRLSEDPEAGADVFSFVDDGLRNLVNAGMLYEVTRNADDIKSRNVESSVDIVTLDGKLWAYPQTADNGYFFFYDKSVISEEDVKSLDGIIAASNAAGKKFTYPIGVAWVTASWFLAQGQLSLVDGQQVCDFNNANGVAAVEAMQAMVNSGAWGNGWVDELVEGIGTTHSGGVGGIWMVADISAKLGDNFGATKLPTAKIGGKEVQLSSFFGCKHVGVNSQTKNPVAAMEFADFLTSEAMQLLNFEMRGMGPSNKNAGASAEVQADIALAALALQSNYAVSQRDVLGGYWSPVEALGNMIINNEVTNIQAALDEVVAQITEAN